MKCNLRNIIFYFLFLFECQPILATTIQKLSFNDMVDMSELIIEGEVVFLTHFSSGNLIYTQIHIKVDDVLKGDYPGEFIELDFLGGDQDGKSAQIAGQDIPIKGEKGFYFIEKLSMKAVNPLTGWSQGHFRILADAKGNEFLASELQQEKKEFVELSENKNAALAAKLRNMKFSSTLVEKAYYAPTTPGELREAVQGYLDGEK